MNELGSALRELAKDGQSAIGADPTDLWSQGRSRVRRRRTAGVGFATCLVVLAALAGSFVPVTQVAMPAGRPHAAALPRAIYEPPSWLSGTDAPGQLAVLGAAPRHQRSELFGISATTGQYKFLDLPDLATTTGAALSPDGRRVAYWNTGSPSGQPFADRDGKVITGLSVLDTVTGDSSQIGPETEHGLAVAGEITWLDDRTIVFSYGQKQTETQGIDIKPYTWTPQAGGRQVVNGFDGVSALARDRDGTVRVGTGTRWAGFGTGLRANGDDVLAPAGSELSLLSRSGSLVVAVGSVRGDDTGSLYTGTAVAGGRVGTLTRVGTFYVGRFLGWASADSVLLSAWSGQSEKGPSLYTVRVTDGSVQRLGAAGAESDTIRGVARELLEDGFVAGRRPPRFDPRIVGAGFGVLVLGTAGALWSWRRRRNE